MQDIKILTPEDCMMWRDFINDLYAHLQFHEGRMFDDIVYLSCCKSTHEMTRNILVANFPEYDAEATILYFKKMGWNCDCKVYLESPSPCDECEKEDEK